MVKLHKCFCLSLHCSSASVCHPLMSQWAPWTRHSCLHLSQAARSSTSSQSAEHKQTGCNQVRNLGLIHLTGHDFHLSTLNNCPSRTLMLPSVEASAFSRILLRTPGARGKRYKAGCAMVNSSPTREHTCPVCSATSCVVRDKNCSLAQHPRSVHLPLWTHHWPLQLLPCIWTHTHTPAVLVKQVFLKPKVAATHHPSSTLEELLSEFGIIFLPPHLSVKENRIRCTTWL